LEIYLKSIDLLEGAFNNHTLCFGHFGTGRSEINYFQIAKEQINVWCRVAKSLDLPDMISEGELNEVIELLTKEDPHFANFENLPSDIQERERIFIKNSISGLK